ncbi:MAG: hypothetical protein HOQ32_03590 [Lysobacter sp.]|nr:hypothetical protein [Lysobacter sp.]
MGKDTADRNREHERDDDSPPKGQGHQTLPGENPSDQDAHARRKHVQNADLPEGEGHQTLPGEDPPSRK